MWWGFTEVSSEEVARQRRRYEPLTEAVRRLVDATVMTDADDDVVASAQSDVEAAVAKLNGRRRDETLGIGLTPEGETVAWGNVAIGLRNPVAPPLVVERDGPTGAHLDVDLGAAYEGAPGHVHGGYSALVLDHLLGDVASYSDPNRVAATGTITYRYERPTRLGHLHAEAEIRDTEGRKIFVVGHVADDEGVTITAEGVFITIGPGFQGV